jgi:hypothetical protein
LGDQAAKQDLKVSACSANAVGDADQPHGGVGDPLTYIFWVLIGTVLERGSKKLQHRFRVCPCVGPCECERSPAGFLVVEHCGEGEYVEVESEINVVIADQCGLNGFDKLTIDMAVCCKVT